MGIPSFFRWVRERYPQCVVSAREEDAVRVNGVEVPVDTTRPNPNGLEFDNLYIDMNSIIHPCFHPEGLPGPKTHEEVFEALYKYIDRIFSVIRPRKLLFLAIDGVAPRAKMNQQRSRRFKSAKDAADNVLGTERLRNATKSGEHLSENQLDSNVITPGTEFMDLLSSALRYYIHLRMNDDLGWRGIKVILSDASVPGEGEHKMMSYIRLQRSLPEYDPNTRHCLYGLDADLIMLALATHEIHFSVLREDARKSGLNKKSSKHSKTMMKGKKWRKEKKMTFGNNLEDYIMRQEFQFVNIWILREYLAYDMKIPSSTLEANLERLIDDFVFMCLFVGNDFLPQIPSLEISEGAINLLMRIYTKEFSERGGYLTKSFEVNLKHVEHFIRSIATHEHKISRKHIRNEKIRVTCSKGLSNSKLADDSSKVPFVERNTESENQESSLPCKIPLISQDTQNIELGWKERYYAEKFGAKFPDDHESVRRDAVTKYIEGICWVMRYYYEGVCSWQWFYPYHYAPFASDFCDINQLKFHFTLGEPFKPFDQLLAVLPAASAHALPLSYRKLMTDVSSPIFDFYPTDFELDMNGKRFSWQAICKLPFIEESRLLSEIAKVEHTLTDEERQRNSPGLDILFLHISHPLAVVIDSFVKLMNGSQEFIEGKVEQKIDPKISGGMNGYIYISDKFMWPVEIPSPVQGMKMITKNEVLFVIYKNPSFHSHIPRLLPGVILPEKSVSEQDILSLRVLPFTNLAHTRLPTSGHNFSGRRPITKLVSGPTLAKFARSLVSQNCIGKQLQTLKNMKFSYNLGPDGLNEMKWNNNKKCKRNEGDGVHVGADALVKMKSGEDKSGDRNVNNIVGKLESCVVGKLTDEGRDDLTGVDGLKEIKEVKSRKRKRKSKKMKQSEAEGISNNNVEKVESCVIEDKCKAEDHLADQDIRGDDVSHKIVETLDSISFREHKEGSHDQVSAHGLQEIKVQIEPRKKKRRPKKKQQNTSESEPNNIVEKLESCLLQEKSKADEELNVKGDSASNSIVEKLESSSFREQQQGDGDQASAHGLQEVKVEVGSRRPKKKKQKPKQNESESAPNSIIEKLESSFLFKADNHNADQQKFEEIKVKRDCVPHNIVQKLDSHTPGEQSDNIGEHAVGGESERAGINGSVELKVEVESKKRKLNEGDDVPHNNVAKLEGSSHGEQNKGSIKLSSDGLQEIKAEVVSKKKRQRLKKWKLTKTDAGQIDIDHKMEISHMEKMDNIGEHTGAVELKEMQNKGTIKLSAGVLQEIKAKDQEMQNKGMIKMSADGLQEKKAKVGSEERKLTTTDAEPIDIVDKMESSHMEKRDSIGEHTGAVELKEMQNKDMIELTADGLQEIKAEVVSKKKRQRVKKWKLTMTDAAQIDIVDKMESRHMEKMDSNDEHTGAVELKEMQNKGTIKLSADGLQEIKDGVGSEERKLTTTDAAPIGNIDQMESSHMEKRDSNGEHIGAVGLKEMQNKKMIKLSADGLQEVKAEAESKKKKRRSKKRKLTATDAAPIDGDELVSSHMEKTDGNDEHIGAVELKEMKTK